MKLYKLTTAVLFILPGLSWGGEPPPPPSVNEPTSLALLLGGVAVAVAIRFMGRKK